jgi:hypothetical protein
MREPHNSMDCRIFLRQDALHTFMSGNDKMESVPAGAGRALLYSRHQQCDGAKEPRPFTRTPSATYRWNARRRTFVTTSTELENLEKLNMKLIMGSGIAPWER